MDGDPTILRPGGRCDGGRPSTLGQEDGHTREEYHKKLALLEALAVANGISRHAVVWIDNNGNGLYHAAQKVNLCNTLPNLS